MKRSYYIFSNGRLVRRQNTVYLHTYAEEREDGDAASLADAAAQSGCVLEDSGEIRDAGDEMRDVGDEMYDSTIPENSSTSPASRDSHPASRTILQKRPIPIADVEAFYVFGETDLNTKLLNFLARHKVPLHIFNYFGFYSGTFYSRQEVNSGHMLVKQVGQYSDPQQRLALARAFVDGASFNILKNLRYYGAASRGRDMSPFIAAIETER